MAGTRLRTMFLLGIALACSFSVASVTGARQEGRRTASPPPSSSSSSESASRVAQGGRGGRLAPPAAVTCDRNNLTVYNGRITYYRRSRTRTVIRVNTDYDTVERVTVRHGADKSPLKSFLLNGEEFKASDLKFIESAPGRLREEMRANIWVCTDGRNPVVDWQTGASKGSAEF